MAIAYVGSASNAVTAASVTATYSSAGGLLIAILIGGSAQPASVISDTAGNTWTLLATTALPTVISIYATQSVVPTSVTSVTASGGTMSSTSWELIILEYSGVADYKQLLSPTTTGTSTTPSLSSTLSGANNFLVSGMVHVTNNSGVFTASTGNLRLQQASTTTRRVAVVDNTAATAISVTTSATIAGLSWGVLTIELFSAVQLNVNNLASGSGGSSTTYTTNAVTVVSGDLVLVALKYTSVTPSTSKLGPPSISGAGLTFNLAAIGPPIGTRQIYLFYAIASGGGSGALTITFGTAPQNDCAWSVERVKGFDTTTSIAWCRQIGMEVVTTSVHNPTLTLDALQDSNSLVYAFCYTSLTAAQWGPGTGWLQLTEIAAQLSSIYKINDNVPNWTNTGTTTVDGIIGIELVAANAATHLNPLQKHSLMMRGEGK